MKRNVLSEFHSFVLFSCVIFPFLLAGVVTHQANLYQTPENQEHHPAHHLLLHLLWVRPSRLLMQLCADKTEQLISSSQKSV